MITIIQLERRLETIYFEKLLNKHYSNIDFFNEQSFTQRVMYKGDNAFP